MRVGPDPSPPPGARGSSTADVKETDPTQDAGTRRGQGIGVGRPVFGAYGFAKREPMLVATVALFLAFAATAPVFPTLGNVENIFRQTAPVLLLGLGLTV